MIFGLRSAKTSPRDQFADKPAVDRPVESTLDRLKIAKMWGERQPETDFGSQNKGNCQSDPWGKIAERKIEFRS